MQNSFAFLLVAASLSLLAQGCSSEPASRYSQKYDSVPERLPSAAELAEPEPRIEPPSRQGNRPYELFGQTWQVMTDARGHVEEGTASWYGEKFHGHLTSNGEIYDMYAMSAAHKTLPLPTYVRVTNLANEQSVVVRVNDRGPFHGDRIIDLSYVAAYKLGMLATGTARVRVEALHPEQDNAQLAVTTPLRPEELVQFYIQVHSGSNQQWLEEAAQQLARIYHVAATTQANNGLYRVVLGPFAGAQADEILEQLRQDGYPDAFRVKAPE
ncbi:septal ring lytic transglycosylase RlpA family protein [Pseudidiomarina sp.]|uniref:septal ring lytic transglycosylase RlpA family protein n=1 Tax=Pseudidiomarina sp. TaxID=2081707 RepID=UPI00299EB888|nr:septal ring lytic transglycosylase RlpA family protein [Pseudidiomarina sp.]MDX1705074.1 septal ring lytic transglycosylase RlpA family protein [Pseudidiomarina sp.]